MNRAPRVTAVIGFAVLLSLAVIASPPDSGDAVPTLTPTTAPPGGAPAAFEAAVKVYPAPINIEKLFEGAKTSQEPGVFNYLKVQFPQVDVTVGGVAKQIFPTTTSINRVMFQAYAKATGSDTSANMQWLLNGITPCSDSSSDVCVEVSTLGGDAAAMAANVRFNKAPAPLMVDGLSGTYRSVGTLVLRNAGNTDAVVTTSQVAIKIGSPTSTDATFALAGNVPLKAAPKGYCTIAITGLESDNFSQPITPGGTANPQTTYVENGNHMVSPVIGGVTGAGAKVVSVNYTTDAGQAPDNITGAWTSVPVTGSALLTATVTLASGQIVSCIGRYQALGSPLNVQVGTGGTCQRFYDLRDYYLNDPDGQTLKPRNGGANEGKGFSYPGLFYQDGKNTEAVYAKDHAEVPAAGVLALGKRNDNVPFTLGPNGETYVPPVSQRQYAGMVVTLNVMGKREEDAPTPIYYAVITDTSVLPNVVLKPTGLPVPEDGETMVGFLTYLAGTARTGAGLEKRGTLDTPFWRFMEGDKPVFAMEFSCNVNIIGLPVIKDKKLPSTLENQRVCLVGSVMKLREVQKGLGRLMLERHVPELANETYDARLFLSARQGKCFPVNAYAKSKCIRPSVGPPALNEQPTDANCSYQVLVNKTGTTRDGCGRLVTYTYPVWETRYHPNCTVQKINKCDAEAAIRFASYEQSRMLGALYFAVKDNNPRDLDFVPLAPVLKEQGIVPHSATVGGMTPRYYTSYPADKVSKDPVTNGPTGIGCAPFQVGTDTQGTRVGVTTADIGAAVQRKPIFTYTWEEAPTECAPEATVDVAYFGSHDCVGVPDTANLCGSNNVPANTTCPGGPDSTGNGVTVKSGGNYIARATGIRFCPGAVSSTSIIVSASPLIVDVNGRGINISRSEADAIAFDIRGDGKRVKVDWPVNNDDIAFLALPSKGAVSSVKQLFGDHSGAKDGFQSLARHDKNKDKIIDEKDAIYGKLRLWFDKNRNGKVDQGELETLAAQGVTKISLTANRPVGSGVEAKTLNSHYFNTKAKEFRNIEDQWFYLYGKEQKAPAKVKKS